VKPFDDSALIVIIRHYSCPAAELAFAVTDQDSLSGHLLVFRSRGGDRLKILLWKKDGFFP